MSHFRRAARRGCSAWGLHLERRTRNRLILAGLLAAGLLSAGGYWAWRKSAADKTAVAEANARAAQALLDLRLAKDAAAAMARAQAEFLIGDGDQALEEARYDDALDAFDRAVSTDPSFADAYLSRGNARFALRRFDEAEQDYQAALLRNADLADAYLALGMLDWTLGRMDDAEKDFASLVLRRPESRFFADRYVTVLYDEGKKRGVQDFYQKLLDADHSRDWAAAGLLYAVEANAADPQQGIKTRLSKAQELWADGVQTLEVRFALGEGLFQTADYLNSIGWLKPLMDEDPNKVPTDAVQHLAAAYKQTRQVDACVTVWRDYMNRMGRSAAFDDAVVRRNCEA